MKLEENDINDKWIRAPNMFSTVHNRPHSQRKRLLTHIYSKSHIHGSPHMVAIARTLLYERLLPLLRPSSSGQLPSQPKTLDVYALFGAAAMDFITAYVFGLRCSTNHLGDKLQNECWIEWYTGREPGRFWSAELPLLKHFFDSVLRLQLTPPRVMQVSNNIDAYCMRLCDQAEALLYSHREKSALKDGEEPFVYAKLRNALGDNEMRPGRLTPDMSVQLEVASEMTDHMGTYAFPCRAATIDIVFESCWLRYLKHHPHLLCMGAFPSLEGAGTSP